MATKKSTTAKRSSKKTSSSEDRDGGTRAKGDDAAPKKEPTTKKARKAPAPKPSKRSESAAASSKKPGAAQVAQRAAAQLAELTDKEVEGVTSLERTEDGWSVELDVVELRRIPSTTDVLATYEVDLDDDGELQSYRRAQRYVRGVAGEE